MILLHHGKMTYGLNGLAQSNGFTPATSIWRIDPQQERDALEIAKTQNRPIEEVWKAMGTPRRVSIQPVLDLGLTLCK